MVISMARNLNKSLFDLAAYDQNGRRALLVEVKRRPAEAAWAAEYRRNLISRGLLGGPELFLFVVPDRLFLWAAHAPADAPPTYETDARPLLARYFQRIGVRPDEIQPLAFEMLVLLWLQELANSEPTSVPAELRDSGLFAAVHGADIEHEPEA
jgi:hypothetical protein